MASSHLALHGAPAEPMRGNDRAVHHGRWSWHLGSLFGIEVRVHATFVMLLAWVALSHVMHGHDVSLALGGVASSRAGDARQRKTCATSEEPQQQPACRCAWGWAECP